MLDTEEVRLQSGLHVERLESLLIDGSAENWWHCRSREGVGSALSDAECDKHSDQAEHWRHFARVNVCRRIAGLPAGRCGCLKVCAPP